MILLANINFSMEDECCRIMSHDSLFFIKERNIIECHLFHCSTYEEEGSSKIYFFAQHKILEGSLFIKKRMFLDNDTQTKQVQDRFRFLVAVKSSHKTWKWHFYFELFIYRKFFLLQCPNYFPSLMKPFIVSIEKNFLIDSLHVIFCNRIYICLQLC